MKGTLGILAATALATLAVALPARGEEQTRDTYRAQVEPLCQANRSANERIMAGARRRVNRKQFDPVAKQFFRVSRSFGDLIRRVAAVSPPLGDEHRIERWIHFMRLLKTRLHAVGGYYARGEDIKAAHESILAERSGINANNVSIVLHFHYCRFGRFVRS